MSPSLGVSWGQEPAICQVTAALPGTQQQWGGACAHCPSWPGPRPDSISCATGKVRAREGEGNPRLAAKAFPASWRRLPGQREERLQRLSRCLTFESALVALSLR